MPGCPSPPSPPRQIPRAGGAVLSHCRRAAVPKQRSGSAVLRGVQNSLLHDPTELAKVTYLHKRVCLRLPRIGKSLISDSRSRSQRAHLADAVHAPVEHPLKGAWFSEAQTARTVCPTVTPSITCLAVTAEWP